MQHRRGRELTGYIHETARIGSIERRLGIGGLSSFTAAR